MPSYIIDLPCCYGRPSSLCCGPPQGRFAIHLPSEEVSLLCYLSLCYDLFPCKAPVYLLSRSLRTYNPPGLYDVDGDDGVTWMVDSGTLSADVYP